MRGLPDGGPDRTAQAKQQQHPRQPFDLLSKRRTKAKTCSNRPVFRIHMYEVTGKAMSVKSDQFLVLVYSKKRTLKWYTRFGSTLRRVEHSRKALYLIARNRSERREHRELEKTHITGGSCRTNEEQSKQNYGIPRPDRLMYACFVPEAHM